MELNGTHVTCCPCYCWWIQHVVSSQIENTIPADLLVAQLSVPASRQIHISCLSYVLAAVAVVDARGHLRLLSRQVAG